MDLITRARIIFHLLRWRVTWNKHDLDYRAGDPDNPRFMSAREASSLIPDGAVVMTSGMAANARCSIFYWLIKDAFARTGHPRDLTWVAVGAMGSRGRVPGSIEELDTPGIIRRYIGGHLETMKAQLKLAERGELELHNLPQGEMAYLVEAQGRGESEIISEVGVDTFLDPRVGSGSLVTPGGGGGLITAHNGQLRYSLPKLDVAMFVAPYADREGNIYMRDAALKTESRESARAAKKNGGKVLVSVSGLIDQDEASIFLPAGEVDAVIVNPYSEQTGGVRQSEYWPMFTEGAQEDREKSAEILKFVNNFLHITPVRTEVDLALARQAAWLFARVVGPGAEVNIGVGLPEEASRLVWEGGLGGEVNFGTETGVHGGLPAPGIYFGAAVNPRRIITSAEIFHYWEKKLDLTMLGMLEADEEGSVNVSHRGEGPLNFVGAGGFPDLVHYAKKIVFVGSWMAGGKLGIENGKLVIRERGKCKFMKKVSRVTMSGRRALELGKEVHYCTNVGRFRLTRRGMELREVMPGVDIRRDIVEGCAMKVVIPDGEVPVTPPEVVTGRGFRLRWHEKEEG